MANEEIRTILAPLTTGHVLLPSAVVAEVLEFKVLEPFKQAPDWLLGELAWRGWQVPVINYLRLIDAQADISISARARILIIKTLGESTQVNFLGLLIQGLPKLKTVSSDALVEKSGSNLPKELFSQVVIDNQPALLPELGELTRTVETQAYGG